MGAPQNGAPFRSALVLVIDLVHVEDEVDELVGITPLVIVPGDELYEMIVQHDACARIEDGGACVGVEVAGNDGLVGVADDALELLGLGSGLHGSLDLFIGGGLCERAGQVDDGNVDGGNPEAHTGQLAVEGGDDLTYGLGGAGGRGDDVVSRSTAAAPILLGGTVDGELSGGDVAQR